MRNLVSRSLKWTLARWCTGNKRLEWLDFGLQSQADSIDKCGFRRRVETWRASMTRRVRSRFHIHIPDLPSRVIVSVRRWTVKDRQSIVEYRGSVIAASIRLRTLRQESSIVFNLRTPTEVWKLTRLSCSERTLRWRGGTWES